MNTLPKILVILGSIREGRRGERVAQWFMDAVKDNIKADIELVDLLDYPLPLFADAVEPSEREGAHPNPTVQKWLSKIESGQGYVVITPEYNHSYPSSLKNTIDYGFKEWVGKPVAFVSYGGGAGGSRAVEHLRQVMIDFNMQNLSTQLIIPNIKKAFDEEGNLANSESLARTANKLIDKIAALIK